MELNVTLFAKRRQTKEGKQFYNYITTLTAKSTGERVSCRVRFSDSDNGVKADECPCNIIVTKGNMQTRTITREDTGEDMTVYTLWVHEWHYSDVPYEDHSLDDFQ